MRRICQHQPVSFRQGFTYIFEAEVVEAEFEVDQRLVHPQAVHELATDLCVQFVVRQVQTQKGRVLRQGLDHLLDTRVLLAVVRQIVRLEVQEPQRLVQAEGQGEDAGRRQTQAVSFELKLPQSLVGEEGSSQILTLFVLDVLANETESLQGGVVSHDLGQNHGASRTQFETREGVVQRGLVDLRLLVRHARLSTRKQIRN